VPSTVLTTKRNASKPHARKKKTRAMRKCERKKRLLWNKVKLFPCNTEYRSKYRHHVFEWRKLVRQRDKDVEERIVESNNLGAFYRYINKRIVNRSDIGAITNDTGRVLIEEDEKANAFNDYFSSVRVKDDNIIPVCTNVVIDKTIDNVEVHETDVYASSNRLKSNLSAGPDGLPPLLFKRLRNSLVFLLTIVLNQLLSVAAIPEEWKKAIITPVFKKVHSDKKLSSNFINIFPALNFVDTAL